MIGDVTAAVRTLARAGVLDPMLPRPSLLRLPARLPFLVPTLSAAVEAHAAMRPNAEAVVDDQGVLTWRELDGRVSRLANALRDRTNGIDDARVAFMVRNGREAVECYAACARIGVAAVPVNTWARPPELAHVVDTQHPAVVVADVEFADVLDEVDLREAARLEVGGTDSYEDALAAASAWPPSVRGGGKIVTHTSGTTGKPKGAERTLGGSSVTALVRFLEKVPLHRRDRFALAPPLFHAFAQGMLGVGLVLGTTILLQRRFDPQDFLRVAVERRATAAALVPVMLRRLLDVTGAPVAERLRIVVLSGSALPEALRVRAEGRFGRVFYDLYGSTEVGWATIATPADHRAKPGSVGCPARGMRAFAADDDGNVLPPGEIGRLFVSTGFEFDGYTAAEADHETVDGAVEFGDRGWVDADGYVFLAGRADDMVVTGGENVYPSEVEEVLAGHEPLAEAAVVGVDDEEYGQVLHAYVVARPGREVTPAAVVEFLRARLARFKVPKHVEVVDALPRNAAGKVVKRDLPPAR